MKRYVSDWQDAGGLGRNHPLAAIVSLIGRIARHGTAALHTLLVLGHRGHAVRELQAQQGTECYDDEQSFPHNPGSTLAG
jgi:hypothetical protein